MKLPKQQIHANDGKHPMPKVIRPKKEPKAPAHKREGIGARLRSMILQRDGGKCVLCGAKPEMSNGTTLHIDHIVPVAQGGKTVEENLATLCQTCNLGKGARRIDILRAIGHAIKPIQENSK